MLNGIKVSDVFPRITFVRKQVVDAISQRFLFFNTQENAIGMAVEMNKAKYGQALYSDRSQLFPIPRPSRPLLLPAFIALKSRLHVFVFESIQVFSFD